ncbi:MAG: hypothetical protein TREMPRED_004139 [Tremellales sp. Tagirdzhanova-0007]|nr:MAG: hypothetical protein TREMPRED_004139 [Tremellales sp. Tagirdzhanova-0007]
MAVALSNPYTNNAQLSVLEQDVLWEYAKLGDKIKRIASLARSAAEIPNETLLAELRTLEKKMGLVLTLFKASVWAVIVDSQAAAEAADQALIADEKPQLGRGSFERNQGRRWIEDDDSMKDER